MITAVYKEYNSSSSDTDSSVEDNNYCGADTRSYSTSGSEDDDNDIDSLKGPERAAVSSVAVTDFDPPTPPTLNNAEDDKHLELNGRKSVRRNNVSIEESH